MARTARPSVAAIATALVESDAADAAALSCWEQSTILLARGVKGGLSVKAIADAAAAAGLSKGSLTSIYYRAAAGAIMIKPVTTDVPERFKSDPRSIMVLCGRIYNRKGGSKILADLISSHTDQTSALSALASEAKTARVTKTDDTARDALALLTAASGPIRAALATDGSTDAATLARTLADEMIKWASKITTPVSASVAA